VVVYTESGRDDPPHVTPKINLAAFQSPGRSRDEFYVNSPRALIKRDAQKFNSSQGIRTTMPLVSLEWHGVCLTMFSIARDCQFRRGPLKKVQGAQGHHPQAP
jgi:hypothetical protein